MREVLVGNLTIDINKTDRGEYHGPGGSVFFMGKIFENFGASATIISPRGADFPTKHLPQTRFVPSEPLFGNTLVFRNTYHGGRREQVVENYAACLSFNWQESLKLVAPDTDIVAVAPILNNIAAGQIKAIKKFFPESFLILLPQGLYRQIDREGKITHNLRSEVEVTIGLFDFVSMSAEDLDNADGRGVAWSRQGPMVAVTKAAKGATLYRHGKRTDYPPFYVGRIVDPTGAGDVFAAAFSYAYRKMLPVAKAVDFAQAAACLSLRERSDQLQYSDEDIINFATARGRRRI